MVKITLDIDQHLRAETEATSVHISHDLVMTLQVEQSQNFLNKIFGGKHTDNLSSQFHGKQIRILAHEPLGVMIAGQVIAKTPTTFTKIPAALKLITARATLPTKSISDFSHRPAAPEPLVPTGQSSHPEQTV
jgi:diacylglycerol kinase family enzyme